MSDPQRNIVVVGGGIMGGDIAIAFSAGGWNVQVVSPSRDTRGLLPQRLAAGLGQLGVAEGRRGALATHGALEDIDWARVDLVIEAVTEDLALKRDLFARIEALAGPDVPLASNTSNFQVGAIAEALKRRNRFLGTHFFMPAHLVPLVEVVSGAQTDPAVADSVGAVLGAIGKTPIRVRKDVPGFIANRIQHAMMREALYLIDEGRRVGRGRGRRGALRLRLPLRRVRPDHAEGDVGLGHQLPCRQRALSPPAQRSALPRRDPANGGRRPGGNEGAPWILGLDR